MGRLVGTILGLIVICLSVFGCGTTDPGSNNRGPLRVEELENGLRSKPSFEATRTEYSTAMNQIADKIAALVPGMAWHVDEDSWIGCGGEYVWTRAKQVYYFIFIVFDSIPQQDRGCIGRAVGLPDARNPRPDTHTGKASEHHLALSSEFPE